MSPSIHSTQDDLLSFIQAVADENFSLVLSEDDLDTALMRAGEKLVLLMAGTTWCTASRAMVNHVKVGLDAHCVFGLSG